QKLPVQVAEGHLDRRGRRHRGRYALPRRRAHRDERELHRLAHRQLMPPDDKAPPEWRPSTAVAQWFEGKDLRELEIIEHGGRQLYPETLKRKLVRDGTQQEVEVYVRIPSTAERALARRDALRWAGELLGREAPKPLTIEGI